MNTQIWKLLSKKGNDAGYIDIGDWLQEVENGSYTGVNSWEEAVVFGLRFNDDELQVMEEKLSVAGTMIEYYDQIVSTYDDIDDQFEWIIGTEKRAREQMPTDNDGLYEIEPPIYNLLTSEYADRAAKLNTEV